MASKESSWGAWWERRSGKAGYMSIIAGPVSIGSPAVNIHLALPQITYDSEEGWNLPVSKHRG